MCNYNNGNTVCGVRKKSFTSLRRKQGFKHSKNYQVIPKSLRSVVDGSGPQTVSFYRPIWPSCLREAAWPRLEDGLHRAKVIFLESLTENLMATFWAIHILCQHILDLFGPTRYVSLNAVLNVNKKGLNPPTQSICWRNIWMVPLRSKSAGIDGAQPLKNADLIRRHRYRTWRFERHRRCITRKWRGGNGGERRHVSKVSLKKKCESQTDIGYVDVNQKKIP